MPIENEGAMGSADEQSRESGIENVVEGNYNGTFLCVDTEDGSETDNSQLTPSIGTPWTPNFTRWRHRFCDNTFLKPHPNRPSCSLTYPSGSPGQASAPTGLFLTYCGCQ